MGVQQQAFKNPSKSEIASGKIHQVVEATFSRRLETQQINVILVLSNSLWTDAGVKTIQ